ncbi:general odorant-binding protein 19d-like [Lycorma delicatula]|uniref:general odorant-binding protein 19d-like n=1 Tax=Lycorma delicatula TaxID=130591 RepID=UPI003F517CD6
MTVFGLDSATTTTLNVSNMKFLPLLLAIATAAFIQTADAKIDKEKKAALVKKCQAETKASDSDIEAVKKHQVPESKEGKCFVACGFNNYGMFRDGKINLEGVNAFFEKVLDEQEHRDKAIKVAASCAATEDVKELDECETAVKYLQCVKTHDEFSEILPLLEPAR